MENQQQSLVPAAVQEEIVPTELKVIVLGDYGVGKTSLVTRYCTGNFSMDRRPVPCILGESINNSKLVKHDNHHYVIKFWDTHGMEKYHNKFPNVYYRDAVGALLVYDVTNPQSLTSLKQWWKDACDVVMKKDGRPIPAVILANKCDLATSGEVELCDELKCYKCFTTSAKTGEGISEAIECLLEDIIKGGLVKEGTECWTEIPTESVRVEQFQTSERVQNKSNCAC